jgi:hypothetical protein
VGDPLYKKQTLVELSSRVDQALFLVMFVFI